MSKSEPNYTNTRIPTGSLPNYSLGQHAYITISLTDRLRLYRFPPTIIGVVRQAITASWLRGLQNEKQDVNYYEFKFNGNPWSGGSEEAVPSRIMMLHVFSALHNHGWNLLTVNDLCRMNYDHNAFIFQLGVISAPTSFFAISRYQQDKLQLICAPPELIPAVQQLFGQANIQNEEWRDGGACYQLKLCGHMWLSGETDETRIKLLGLLDCFASFGWQLHTGIYVNGTPETCEADTWFFRQKIQ